MFKTPSIDVAHLRIAKGWLGNDEVRKIAAKFLYEVKHVHASCLSKGKNQEGWKEEKMGYGQKISHLSDRLIASSSLQIQVNTICSILFPVGNLVLHKSVRFLCERKGHLQRHLFCCLLRFQPSPGVWIETVFIPGRQSGGFPLALTILPANSKDDGGVSRNGTFRILTSGHCCKIAVDFMFQVFLSFITKLPERERHQHGCWIDKGEV